MFANSSCTRGHWLKLQKIQSRINIRHNFFSNRVVNEWDGLPEKVVLASSVNGLKNPLTSNLSIVIGIFKMSVVKFLPINGLRSFCCQRNRFHTAAVVWSSKSVQNYQFKELDGVIDPYSSSIVRNDRYNSKAEQEVKETLVRVRHGGSKSAHERHTMKNNKLFARDRLKKLLDPGTEEDFLEIAPFAGLGMEYGDVPAAGIVSIIGRIHNKWCLVGNNDATVKGGTSFPITVEKQIRTQDIALQNCLPVIYGVDSGGAFLPLQASIFPDRKHGGRVFYNEAILSSLGIPQEHAQ
ncbi:putative methylcrotonoyl-CoA carboxylase beta chain, mitochondrial-like [Apostichopus japonicus]|uniref:methylcrotonoyl-CoA carboxylase n=1 Tax=Stichopus japonicus TaxID=307972 RepID=A0A2G8JE67_STIJA|nr:putative methylcrotonoyl-CoA carboxylase beta chain, mitochondrial-like [Apostichopus japonicus]